MYFERVRDELRDGRTLPAAVAQGWSRARRTIVASDTVNFLAAIVLYFLAVGGVRGFAFTLGLTTIVDLAVVVMFTHPVLAILANTRFFGEGHRFSGLDPSQLGAPFALRRPRPGRGRRRAREPGPSRAAPDHRRARAAEKAAAGSSGTEGKDA